MINPKTLFSPFVPVSFRPLLSCVTPNAFRVIEWRRILSHAPTLAKRIATGEGVDELKMKMSPLIPKKITLCDDGDWSGAAPLKPEQGESILELYFAQLKSDEGIFLDLRPSSFRLSDEGEILWHPNGLWKELDSEFRKGMLAVYEGYYLGQPETLRRGLLQVGLIKNEFSSDLVSEVEGMILGHIGGETLNQSFEVSHFTQSFERLFQFLIKEKIVLPPDFLYLGIYLGGMYIHLETLGASYNVRRAFMGVDF